MDILIHDGVHVADVERQISSFPCKQDCWSFQGMRPTDLVEYVRIMVGHLRNDDAAALNLVLNLLDNRTTVLNLIRSYARKAHFLYTSPSRSIGIQLVL